MNILNRVSKYSVSKYNMKEKTQNTKYLRLQSVLFAPKYVCMHTILFNSQSACLYFEKTDSQV